MFCVKTLSSLLNVTLSGQKIHIADNINCKCTVEQGVMTVYPSFDG